MDFLSVLFGAVIMFIGVITGFTIAVYTHKDTSDAE